jgi:two-component system NarL family response regulator
MPTTGSNLDFRSRGGRRTAVFGARTDSNPAGTGIRTREILKKQDHSLALPPSANRQLISDSARLEEMEQRPVQSNAAKTKSFNLLVADDHPIVLEGLVSLINRQSNMQVVAQARNGSEAVEAFFSQRPDIAILDLRMPVMDGVEAITSICKKDPEARLIIVTIYQSEEDIYRALRAGARGIILKDAPAEEIIECIQAVGEGKTWIPPEVGAKLAKRVTVRELTPREMEVMHAVAKGKSNKEIGLALDISEATVKVHVTHILEKLQASGRTEAIGLAVNRGLVRMDAVVAA